ncbi:MAG TPA: diguanylate cyclase [Candidatus Acidoferrales bacterium]|nr:diguanylate cyclase [Candidatus Acidoferrales bacterium]
MQRDAEPRINPDALARDETPMTVSEIGAFRHVHFAGAEGNIQLTMATGRKPLLGQRESAERTTSDSEKLNLAISPGHDALLAAVVNSAHEAIIGMSMSGIIVSWNGGAQRVYQYPPEEAIGRSFSLLVPLDRINEFLKFVDQAHRGEHVLMHETVHVRKGGTHLPVSVSISPIRNSAGATAGVSAIVRDAGKPSSAEQELRRTNEKLVEMVNDLQQRNSEMKLLQELNEKLESCCSTNEVHPVLRTLLPKLFHTGSGTLFEWNPDLKLLESGVSWGERSSQESLFSSEECWALRSSRPHEVVGSDSSVRCPHLARLTQTNTICAPLLASGETLGLLCLRSSPYELSQPKEVQDRLSTARLRVVEAASRHIALTLSNLKLRERLQAQSIRDPVTGLFNRRYLDETLQREVHRSARDAKYFSLILCDIDHFKQFNDVNGHAAGDSLLQSFGALVQKTVRAGDIACRYGGDEFVLLLVDTSLDTANSRADLLKREFQRLSIFNGETSLSAGTLTLGVSSYPIHGVSPSALLAAADRALYRGKAGGGNRAIIGVASE